MNTFSSAAPAAEIPKANQTTAAATQMFSRFIIPPQPTASTAPTSCAFYHGAPRPDMENRRINQHPDETRPALRISENLAEWLKRATGTATRLVMAGATNAGPVFGDPDELSLGRRIRCDDHRNLGWEVAYRFPASSLPEPRGT